MLWRTRAQTFDLSRRALIMGVLNLTPDSFSDGGRFVDPFRAVEHARQMLAEGADLIDIGGESTRPGAETVSEEEELRRVLPVIRELAAEMRCVVSIDTMKPAVAWAAVQAGAGVINDVRGLRDERMRAVVVETGVGAIAMHMQGEPKTMQLSPSYTHIVREIGEFFRQTYAACIASGMDATRLALDPGLGFGKTGAHNLAVLKHLGALRVHERPLVVGASRKSFLRAACGGTDPDDRLWPTVALTSYARSHGASIFRVHDVRPNAEALRMTEAILMA